MILKIRFYWKMYRDVNFFIFYKESTSDGLRLVRTCYKEHESITEKYDTIKFGDAHKVGYRKIPSPLKKCIRRDIIFSFFTKQARAMDCVLQEHLIKHTN